jgi:hypothetical protein
MLLVLDMDASFPWFCLFLFLCFGCLFVTECARIHLFGVQMYDGDLKLIVYCSLFVVCCKEVSNFIKIKSLFGILSKREMKWGTLERIGAEKKQTKYQLLILFPNYLALVF